MSNIWNQVSCPINQADPLPPERKVVAVWCDGHNGIGEHVGGEYLPYMGYVRYSGGERDKPFFVVYHGCPSNPVDVIAWCDCLPDTGPEWTDKASMYSREQASGRGFPLRRMKSKPKRAR
jgi:hypothetical protein